jgi:GNAT superfamily N-acetyltransferase
MYAITCEDHNLAAVAAELDARLTRFNEAQAGPLRTRHVALTVRDHSGTMVAGLTAEIFWNALYVHLLWVDEACRRQNYGTLLLRRAENVAIENSRCSRGRPVNASTSRIDIEG